LDVKFGLWSLVLHGNVGIRRAPSAVSSMCLNRCVEYLNNTVTDFWSPFDRYSPCRGGRSRAGGGEPEAGGDAKDTGAGAAANFREALDLWREVVEELKAARAEELEAARAEEERKKAVMRRILAHMVQPSVLQAFHGWMEVMEEAKAARVEEERRQAVMRRILVRMLQRSVSKALDRWMEALDAGAEEERKQSVLRGILAWMLQRTTAQALERWKEVVEEAAAALAEEEREKLETLKAKARMAHTMVHPRASKVIDTKADADVVTPSDAEQEAEMPRMHARIAAKSVP